MLKKREKTGSGKQCRLEEMNSGHISQQLGRGPLGKACYSEIGGWSLLLERTGEWCLQIHKELWCLLTLQVRQCSLSMYVTAPTHSKCNIAEISMDFIEGLPKSQGMDVIMVVVHRLTKYNHSVGLKHPFTALVVAQAFMDNIYKLHGLPNTIVSYRYSVSLSHFWQEIFRLQRVELHLSSAYHPQTDGQT